MFRRNVRKQQSRKLCALKICMLMVLTSHSNIHVTCISCLHSHHVQLSYEWSTSLCDGMLRCRLLGWMQCAHCMWSAKLSFLLCTWWELVRSHTNFLILHMQPAFGTYASTFTVSSNPSEALLTPRIPYTQISWVPRYISSTLKFAQEITRETIPL